MAEYTTNFRLIKPEDGATEWGSKLNDNFDTIDGGLIELRSKTNNNLTSSGIFSAVDFTLQNNNKELDISSLDYYFSFYKESKSGGIGTNFDPGVIKISDIENTFVLQNDKYKNLFIFLTASGEDEQYNLIVSLQIVTSENLNQEWLTDGKHILLGEVVIYKTNDNVYFAENLCTCSPWRAEYQLNNRIEDFNNFGSVNNLNLQYHNENDRTYLRANDNTYTWYLEGINGSDNINPNVINNFLVIENSNIKFFKAFPNEIYDLDELELYTTIQDQAGNIKYINDDSLATLPSNKYTGYRIGLTKSHNLVLFYTDICADTKEIAIGSMSNLTELVTSIPQKEIGRLVINSDGSIVEIINFYPSMSENELMLSFKNYLDPGKTAYIFADTAEIRNTGFLDLHHDIEDETHTLKIWGTICRVNKENLKTTSIEYIEIEETNPKTLVETALTQYRLQVIYITNNYTIGTYLLGNSKPSDFLCRIGYVIGQRINEILYSPEYCNVNDSTKENFLVNGLIFDGLVVNNRATFTMPNYANNILYGEGIAYNTSSAWKITNNIIKLDSANPIWIDYLKTTDSGHNFNGNIDIHTTREDSIENLLIDCTAARSGYWTIQKLILDANGRWHLIGGNQDYQNEPTDIFTNEDYTLNHNVGIEVARILFDGNYDHIKLYFTYKDNFSPTVVEIKAATQQETGSFSDGDFEVYNSTDNSKKFVVDVTNSFQIKTSEINRSGAYDLGEMDTNITNTQNKLGIQPQSGALDGKTAFQCSEYLLSQITEMNTNLNGIISTGTTPPGSNKTSWIYIDTSTHKVYVWDDLKYQLMNSWQ